ncbi:MAG: copper resistance protein NlpE N-terminal domain-containing protein [Tunicatimonas sp.]
MNRSSHYLALGALLLSSCSRPPVEVLTGTFYGTLPCADCPGIRYELTLNDDGTYVERMEYLEKSAAVRIDSGIYEMQQDTVVRLLKPSGTGLNRWAVADGKLRMLDASGAPIKSDFAQQYVLSPNEPTARQNQVDFKATGNEPFWSLEIDFRRQMRFRDLNGLELATPVPEASYPQENVTTWNATTEQGELSVMVTRERCQDTMSDDTFDYRVQVQAVVGSAVPQSYAGCGRYQGRYQLNKRWELLSRNGQAVEAENKPYVEFQLAEDRAVGFGGCNRFSGSVEVTDDSLRFGSMASTKMACPSLNSEATFLRAFSQQKLSFRIEEQQLRLSNDSTQLLFRAAE